MKFLQSQKGLTLIEIMMALVVGTILILAFSGAFTASYRTEFITDKRVEAARIADSIIEYLRDNNLNELNSTDIEDSFDKNISISINNSNDNADINIDSEKKDNLYLVAIEWKDRNYRIETFLAGE